ncbi:hypothetical protein FQA39_LY00695 [Lamprigera yunnana]|nr:hypothetical protein FQA39_LY00695 [Lamprigera yunnana]
MIPPGFSLSDALDIIFANDDIANQVDEVFIEPPEATVDTDEDSAEEDQGGMLHNLTGRQLRAPVEIRLIDKYTESPPSESAPSESPSISSTSENHMPPSASYKNDWINNKLAKKSDHRWIEGDIEPGPQIFPLLHTEDYTRFENSKDDIPLSTYVRDNDDRFELDRDIWVPGVSGYSQHQSRYSSGDYVLVKYVTKKTEYHYAAICFSVDDEDGELRMTFLKICNQSGTV